MLAYVFFLCEGWSVNPFVKSISVGYIPSFLFLFFRLTSVFSFVFKSISVGFLFPLFLSSFFVYCLSILKSISERFLVLIFICDSLPATPVVCFEYFYSHQNITWLSRLVSMLYCFSNWFMMTFLCSSYSDVSLKYDWCYSFQGRSLFLLSISYFYTWQVSLISRC